MFCLDDSYMKKLVEKIIDFIESKEKEENKKKIQSKNTAINNSVEKERGK